mgnify:CR=1 FL=1
MSQDWMTRKKQDGFYKMAKREGYRSRASYKLIQINGKYRVIRNGDRVLDLGAAPGGWLQVAKEIVGEEGYVVGVDLQRIKPIEGVELIRGDMTDEMVKRRILEKTKGEPFDVILSDMAPDMSGNYSVDHARSIHLNEIALKVCSSLLKDRGKFVTKVFQGDMIEDFLKLLRENFGRVRRFSPEASRSRSAEVYVVCLGFNGQKE